MVELQEPECENFECDHCALEEALDILREALQEHEKTWGLAKSRARVDDWSVRAVVLLSKRENKQ
jgi:hypothetical protein